MINKRNPFQFALDLHSGVPVYRQIIDHVIGGIAAGILVAGDQLPTVRQLAVDLSINPNTVIRAYRELEIRGVLETQQGTGTFISNQKPQRDDADRQRRLTQLVGEFIARAGSAGFTVEDLPERPQSIEYGHRRPHPDRWQLRRLLEWLTAGCFVGALYFGGMSYFLSRKLATPTPEYAQFRRSMEAQAATRPAGAAFEWPQFTGQAYLPRPVLSLPTTYIALGLAGAGVALVVLCIRRIGAE